MADGAKMTTAGMEDMLREFQDLPKVIRKRLMIGAVASAARRVRDDARLLAPLYSGQVGKDHSPPGTLKKAIYMARLIPKCTDTQEVWAVDVFTGGRKITRGKNKGKVSWDTDAYYAAWVEYGHYTRVPGSTRRQHKDAVKSKTALSLGAKWVGPKPFMRPAFERNKVASLQIMADYIGKNLPIALSAFKFIKAT